MELPNGQKYLFRYNTYGELARVTLPTGGSFEYDWLPYSGTSGGGEYGDFMIYRRVRERRVYESNNNLVSLNRYDAPTLSSVTGTTRARSRSSNPTRLKLSGQRCVGLPQQDLGRPVRRHPRTLPRRHARTALS